MRLGGLVFIILGMFVFGATLMWLFSSQSGVLQTKKHWDFQSIDTMKNSRDLAREELHNPTAIKDIEKQVSDIQKTGATHVAIGTPYDKEFLPVIELWTRTVHQHGMHVWFRGNWSGWEGWFGYAQIDEKTHRENTKQFILENSQLFHDGDVFSSCPECENGAKVELGNEYAIQKYRLFLKEEYRTTKAAFAAINKKVPSNYFSMNADVARKVMDPETTRSLDGLVVIDHYVKDPQELAQDVINIAQHSKGEVVLGEIGVPIPDINGSMNDDEQKKWLSDALMFLSTVDALKGVNYWVNKGGSTALWNENGTPKPAQDVLRQYYGGSSL